MAGRAGSMASMARAFSAIIMAIRATNSGKPGPLKAGVAGPEPGAVIGVRCGLRFAGASLETAAEGDFSPAGC